jgi:hypothetical protein
VAGIVYARLGPSSARGKSRAGGPDLRCGCRTPHTLGTLQQTGIIIVGGHATGISQRGIIIVGG